LDLVYAALPLHCVFVDNLRAYEATLFQIAEDLFHLVDESGVACQILYLFVGDDQLSDGLGEVDEEGGVADVVLGECACVVAYLLGVLLRVRAEDRQTQHSVPHHECAVLDQHAVEHAHVQFLVHDALAVLYEFLDRVTPT
jgi:hypothetical protein